MHGIYKAPSTKYELDTCVSTESKKKGQGIEQKMSMWGDKDKRPKARI